MRDSQSVAAVLTRMVEDTDGVESGTNGSDNETEEDTDQSVHVLREAHEDNVGQTISAGLAFESPVVTKDATEVI